MIKKLLKPSNLRGQVLIFSGAIITGTAYGTLIGQIIGKIIYG